MLIIVPYDFSKAATNALAQALLFASHYRGVDVEVLHVCNDSVVRGYPSSWGIVAADMHRVAARLTKAVEKVAGKLSLPRPVRTSVYVKPGSNVITGIQNRCIERRVDLVIMGTHGQTGLLEKLAGTNTSALVGLSLFPVLAVPPSWKPALTDTLVAAMDIDDLPALGSRAVGWSKTMRSALEIVHFNINPDVNLAPVSALTSVSRSVVNVQRFDPGYSLAQHLVRYMKGRKKAVLAMFVHERKPLERVFDRSITGRVSTRLNAPLLALPRHDILNLRDQGVAR